MGVNTWSWYIPITTSNFFTFFSINKVSAAKGPKILIFFFVKYFIAGLIILFSSFLFSVDSQWGFKPVIAIFGILFKNFL